MLRKFVHSVNRMSSLALLTRNPSAYAIRAEVIFNLLLLLFVLLWTFCKFFLELSLAGDQLFSEVFEDVFPFALILVDFVVDEGEDAGDGLVEGGRLERLFHLVDEGGLVVFVGFDEDVLLERPHSQLCPKLTTQYLSRLTCSISDHP